MPASARWPGHISPGLTLVETASTLDLFPTFVALARGTMPRKSYPGEDITSLLTGAKDRLGGEGIEGGREAICWYKGEATTLRSGRWKYHRPNDKNAERTLLHDLEADPGELYDLSQSEPEVLLQLERRLQQLAGQ